MNPPPDSSSLEPGISRRTVLGYTKAVIVERACIHAPITEAMIGDGGLIVDEKIRADLASALTTLADHVRGRRWRETALPAG